MFKLLETFTNIVIDVNEFWVACICHPVVANEDDVNDVRQIPGFEGIVYIPGKSIHFEEDMLLPRRWLVLKVIPQGKFVYIDEIGRRTCKMTSLIQRRLVS